MTFTHQILHLRRRLYCPTRLIRDLLLPLGLAVSLADGALAEWRYDQHVDALRGTTSALATVTSNNTVPLSWPTGDVVPLLTLRLDNPRTLKVYIVAENAQFVCGLYDVVTVRFDDGPIEEYRCHNADGGVLDTAFIQEPMRFLERLKGSTSILIEATFYRDGAQQFSFPVSNLVWTLDKGN